MSLINEVLAEQAMELQGHPHVLEKHKSPVREKSVLLADGKI